LITQHTWFYGSSENSQVSLDIPAPPLFINCGTKRQEYFVLQLRKYEPDFNDLGIKMKVKGRQTTTVNNFYSKVNGFYEINRNSYICNIFEDALAAILKVAILRVFPYLDSSILFLCSIRT
jgi:hypothetical protein